MRYINIRQYSKKDFKFILIFVISVVWVSVSLFFVSKIIPFQGIPVAQASVGGISYVRAIGSTVEVGPETQNLIERIKELGLDPIPVGNITRVFFSVQGKIITLNNDNMKVFEYRDKLALLSDVSSFQKDATTPRGSWKKDIHLYANENLIVFYMGDKVNIVKALDSIFGKAVVV